MRYLEVRDDHGDAFARLVFNAPGPDDEELEPLQELCAKHSLKVVLARVDDLDLPELIEAIRDEYEVEE
jgi:hypothetical protein